MPVSNVQISEERLVAQHILSLMETGRLLPGDRLPAERKLSADLSVSRAHVRAAIQRLEFDGIVKTFPQSGTILTDHKASVLQNQLRNILDINSFDFYSLVQVRILLESNQKFHHKPHEPLLSSSSPPHQHHIGLPRLSEVQ